MLHTPRIFLLVAATTMALAIGHGPGLTGAEAAAATPSGSSIKVPSLRVGPDAPREWACIGCHEQQVDADAWKNSLHRQAGVSCLHCHPEAEAVPHPDTVSSINCAECHEDANVTVESVAASAHGTSGPGGTNNCSGCHNPHLMEAGTSGEAFVRAGCLACHDEDDGLVDLHKDAFPSTALHLDKVGCQYCHLQGEASEAVHNVRFGESAKMECDDCHGKDSEMLAGGVSDVGLLKMQNNKLARETGYLIGANRIPLLDYMMILMVLGIFGFPAVHGGLRFYFAWRAR